MKINQINNSKMQFCLLILIVIGILPILPKVCAIEIDPLLTSMLENQYEAQAIVILKDNSNLTYSGLKANRREIFEEKREYFYQSEENVISTLSKSDFKVVYKFATINAFGGYITKSGFEKLKNNPYVVDIQANREVNLLLDTSKDIINAPNIWDLDYKGEGQTVCVIDGGIDWTHPAMGGCFGSGCKVIDGYDYYDNDDDPMDHYGHGTHVAGIVAADGWLRNGIAPKSNLIAMKVCSDENDSCNTNAIAYGVDWCINNADLYNINIITISIGDNISHSNPDCNPSWTASQKINSAYDAGLFVSISSGNDGYTNGISWPACTNATSVGATTKSDIMWSDTNRDEILDLLAPGVDIISTHDDWEEGICWWPFDYDDEDGCDYISKTGTSMAAPHVAGAVALLKDADDTNSVTNSPMHVRELLKETGKPIYDSALGLVIPRLDILKAFGIDWPTYHHDNRRTGYTLLKGDLAGDSPKEASWKLAENIDESYYDFASMSDVDNDGQQEVITATSTYKQGAHIGSLYVLDCIKSNNKCKSFKERWSFTDGYIVNRAPTIEDLNLDNKNEVIFASFKGTDGTLYAIDGKAKGDITPTNSKKGSIKWKYTLPPESNQSGEDDIGYATGADIDLDGKKEVLIADYTGSLDWDGHLYTLEDNGALKDNLGGIGGGAFGAPAVANIKTSTDYPEVVVPGAFGLFVYEYDPSLNSGKGGLKLLWGNNDAYIDNTAIIADVDANNEYEIVYLTNDYYSSECSTVGCTNQLKVVDALTGSPECTYNLTEYPNADPAVGNLDSDKNLEIVVSTRNDLSNNPSYGYIQSFDGNTCDLQNTYGGAGTDTRYAAPDIFDIDNNGVNDVLFSLTNGTLMVLDNNLDPKWDYDLGGELASAPAIGDLDDDGMAEIAAKRISTSGSSSMAYNDKVTSRVMDVRDRHILSPSMFSGLATVDSVLTVVGGNNTQPLISEEVDDLYAIEGDLINVTVDAVDYDEDPINFSFSSPLNESGEWQTDENSSGVYEVLAEVTDDNLTDSQFFSVTVYDEGTLLKDNFSDGSVYKELAFYEAGDKTVYVDLDRKINVLRAAIKPKGFSLNDEQNVFQEPTPSIIEVNDIGIALTSNLIDKDWNSYYSAGSATGAIVEIDDLTVPGGFEHVIFHLKIRVYGGGSGRFAAYNYDTGNYEVVTSSIPAFSNMSDDFYFDVYENNPLWVDNNTHYSMKVDNISSYVNNDTIRWYYRYLGDWASQMIYESEVKFESDVIYPRDIRLDLGDDGTTDLEYDGELHDRYVKLDSLNNSNKNETISLNNNSVTEYIKLPKDAVLNKAEISVGKKEVENLRIDNLQNEESEITITKGENFNTYGYDDKKQSTVIYNKPVNYFDGKEYLPIDTSIQPSENGYEVVKGVYKAYFGKDMEVRIEKDGNYLSFKPDFGNKTLENIVVDKNQIVYKNVVKDVDLSYTYENTELKEEFILNSLPPLETIQFTIDTDGLLEPTNNSVSVKKDGQTVFYLPKLYAYDANNKRRELSFKLEGNIFTIELPVDWLKNAVYPVRIDPTTMVDVSAYATVEQDDDETCDIVPTSYSDPTNRARSLLKFPLTSLPYCKTVDITEAKVYLYDTDDTITEGECTEGKTLNIVMRDDDGWTCNPSLTWQNSVNFSLSEVLDNTCAWNQGNWYNWDVYEPGIGKKDIEYDFYTNCDNTISFILAFVDETADPTEQVTFSTDAYLNVTYDIIPSNDSYLEGCSDGYTGMNSDGSDVSIDLWGCYFNEGGANASDATFSIVSESNTDLINCSVSGNRYVACGAPAVGAVGYSDVNVSVVDDMNSSDEDAVRVYVLKGGNVTVYINDSEVWKGSSWDYSDLDVMLEIQNYLEACENDSIGNCEVPLRFESDSDVDFNLNAIDIDYKLKEMEFSSALQNYLDDFCYSDKCTVPLKFSVSSEGKLNLTDLQIFYTPIVNTAPSNSTLLYPNGGETIDSGTTINWTESVDLERTYDSVKYFLQYSNDSGTNWYDLILDYGYESKLNDTSVEKNVTFSGNENQTVYLRLPKNARVLDARLDLTGFE